MRNLTHSNDIFLPEMSKSKVINDIISRPSLKKAAFNNRDSPKNFPMPEKLGL
jgi:hypothetical protein